MLGTCVDPCSEAPSSCASVSVGMKRDSHLKFPWSFGLRRHEQCSWRWDLLVEVKISLALKS